MRTLTIVIMLFFAVNLSAQTVKTDLVWSTKTTLKANDTLRFETRDVIPTFADSVSGYFYADADSVKALVTFKPSLPNKYIIPTATPDTVLNKTTLTEKGKIGVSVKGTASKQYGKLYITIIYTGTRTLTNQELSLWILRRYN